MSVFFQTSICNLLRDNFCYILVVFSSKPEEEKCLLRYHLLNNVSLLDFKSHCTKSPMLGMFSLILVESPDCRATFLSWPEEGDTMGTVPVQEWRKKTKKWDPLRFNKKFVCFVFQSISHLWNSLWNSLFNNESCRVFIAAVAWFLSMLIIKSTLLTRCTKHQHNML